MTEALAMLALAEEALALRVQTDALLGQDDGADRRIVERCHRLLAAYGVDEWPADDVWTFAGMDVDGPTFGPNEPLLPEAVAVRWADPLAAEDGPR